MTDRHEPFGRVAIRAASPADLLALEEREGRSDRFEVIEALIEHLLRRSLAGGVFYAGPARLCKARSAPQHGCLKGGGRGGTPPPPP